MVIIDIITNLFAGFGLFVFLLIMVIKGMEKETFKRLFSKSVDELIMKAKAKIKVQEEKIKKFESLKEVAENLKNNK